MKHLCKVRGKLLLSLVLVLFLIISITGYINTSASSEEKRYSDNNTKLIQGNVSESDKKLLPQLRNIDETAVIIVTLALEKVSVYKTKAC